MSVMRADRSAPPAAAPRVRELARAAVVRMLFSAAVSVSVALALLLLARGLGR
jgi:hypothetical protein